MRQDRNDDGGRGNRGRSDGCRFRQHRRRGSHRCGSPGRHEDGAGRLLHHGHRVGDCLRCLGVGQRCAQYCRVLAGVGPLIGSRPDGDDERGQQRQHTDDEDCHECATDEYERFVFGRSRIHRVIIRVAIGKFVGHGAIPQRGHVASGRSLGDDPSDCGNVPGRCHTHGLSIESRGVRCCQRRAARQSQRTVFGRMHGEGGPGRDLRLQLGDIDARADHEHRLRRLSQPLKAGHHAL